ncbi:RES family NAD+ phosphorylase [Pelomonas sp. Root1217]|uniref:RES family NAD+ phosphorylase n=1 Tax=Pelomonas sp. Root1217 TaxID=1736430 RepID=UPI001F2AAF6E|nr:RES family NAD+ phosphorylase [Pelomonas sp. Root1217]
MAKLFTITSAQEGNQNLQQLTLNGERGRGPWVCQDCLADSILRQLFADPMEAHQCDVCGSEKTNVLTVERIASFIRKGLEDHFELDEGLYPGYELSLQAVVQQAIGCESGSICRAIADQLEDADADEDDFYFPGQTYFLAASPFDDEAHERWYVTGEWHQLAMELGHDRRFFNERARQFFESLINEALEARDEQRQDAPAVVTALPAGTSFYRARRAGGPTEAKKFAANPIEEMGAPPKERAANNRMSASGVPLLYVSAGADTAIAEIRPAIGDTVAVGRFVSTAPLQFFDFTALSRRLQHTRLSFFDPRHLEREQHRKLLQYLHDEIARPVGATDVEYVMTQALAELIRYDKPGAFDGISFRSVQHEGGVNFVLFGKQDHLLRAMRSPEWRPEFDVAIDSSDVTFRKIEGVAYRHTVAPRTD